MSGPSGVAKPDQEAGAGSGPEMRSRSVGCLGNLPTSHSKASVLKQRHSRARRRSTGPHSDTTPPWGRQVAGPWSCPRRGPFSSCFRVFIRRARARLGEQQPELLGAACVVPAASATSAREISAASFRFFLTFPSRSRDRPDPHTQRKAGLGEAGVLSTNQCCRRLPPEKMHLR